MKHNRKPAAPGRRSRTREVESITMQDQYSRTQLLLGKEAMETLHHSRVAVFGIGGVGGYTVEALARSGVGALDLIDDDKVCLTNLNRQIVATRKTVGQYKVDVAEQRIHEIDPNIKVTTYKTFFTPETQDQFDFTQYDYVVDAIDTVTGKIALVVKAKEAGTPIICAMGAGNKMAPTRFEVTDIYKTSVCPLAKVMRTECRKRKIKHLKVVYSKEPVMTPIEDDSSAARITASARRAPSASAPSAAPSPAPMPLCRRSPASSSAARSSRTSSVSCL